MSTCTCICHCLYTKYLQASCQLSRNTQLKRQFAYVYISMSAHRNNLSVTVTVIVTLSAKFPALYEVLYSQNDLNTSDGKAEH